jgi:hypothetical protein
MSFRASDLVRGIRGSCIMDIEKDLDDLGRRGGERKWNLTVS